MTKVVGNTLVLGEHSLAYKCWGDIKDPAKTIVALHGWQDNAASFDLLAPVLSQYYRLIAVDLAGHGLSYHRSRDSGYNIWQDLRDINQLADALGLERFILMGHSRGAIISTLYGATFPRQVKKLVLLDGFLPEPVRPEEAPHQLARAILDNRVLGAKAPRLYASMEEALSSRMGGRLALSEDAARRIASRGLECKDDKYFWRADVRLKGASDIKLTAEHCRAFVQSIGCPSLLLKARDHQLTLESELVAANPYIRLKELPGGHHFHLEERFCQAVAENILTFLRQQG